MGCLETIDKRELKELLNKNWITHDAMWLYHCIEKLGIEQANELNLAAVRSLAAIEIARVKKAMGKDKDWKPGNFEELRIFLEDAIDLVLPRFMKFTYDFPGGDALRAGYPPGECFAYKGMKGLGHLSGYQCGVFVRIDGWLDGIGINYEAIPQLGRCLEFEHGKCERTYVFHFPTDNDGGQSGG